MDDTAINGNLSLKEHHEPMDTSSLEHGSSV
jgi:hypothetical protein